eukprot:EC726385.1.p1 GENE.EC726385.1~~EC726385.1.p1  ORF type:complete len:216 (+),score=7.22 EC726385.1:87-650(+)
MADPPQIVDPWFFPYSADIERKLSEFGSPGQSELTEDLIDVLRVVARAGVSCYEWSGLKKIIHAQLESMINWLSTTDTTIPQAELGPYKQELHQEIDRFDETPFTIQRLCELITSPSRNYATLKKLMYAIEKCLRGVTLTLPRHDPAVPVVLPQEPVAPSAPPPPEVIAAMFAGAAESTSTDRMDLS